MTTETAEILTNVNPWKRMWIRPGKTVGEILHSRWAGWKWLWFFAVLSGLELLFPFTLLIPAEPVTRLFLWLAAGVLIGIPACLLESLLFHLAGKMLGGRASWRHTLTAVAWSYLPYLLPLALIDVPILLSYWLDWKGSVAVTFFLLTVVKWIFFSGMR